MNLFYCLENNKINNLCTTTYQVVSLNLTALVSQTVFQGDLTYSWNTIDLSPRLVLIP